MGITKASTKYPRRERSKLHMDGQNASHEGHEKKDTKQATGGTSKSQEEPEEKVHEKTERMNLNQQHPRSKQQTWLQTVVQNDGRRAQSRRPTEGVAARDNGNNKWTKQRDRETKKEEMGRRQRKGSQPSTVGKSNHKQSRDKRRKHTTTRRAGPTWPRMPCAASGCS